MPTRVELGNFFSLFRPGTQAGLFFHGIDSQWTRPQIHHSGQTLRPFPPLFLPRLVNACLATVCGYGPTCGGVLFFLFLPPTHALWKTATSLTAPESQQPAYVSGEFHERHHPALSSRISHGRYFTTTGLSSARARSKTSGQIDSESAGIFGGSVHFLSADAGTPRVALS